MDNKQQVSPGSRMYLVVHTVFKMTSFEKVFCLISVDVALVYALYTCCVDYSNILPHILLHNLPTNCQLMVTLLNIWYW